jgi:hypothetical protein
MEMEALPDELHVHIFSFLSVFDLCRYVSPAPFMNQPLMGVEVRG